MLWLATGIALLVAAGLPAAAQAASVSPDPIWQTPTDGLTGTAAGRLTGVEGVAADPTSGRIYAFERSNARVDVFSPFGSFLFAWGWGVATGAAQFETCGPSASPPTATCRAGLNGSGPGQFQNGSKGSGGVAVGPEGDIYVGDMANHRVQKFTADGAFVLMFGKGVDQGPSTPGDVCTATALAGGETCGAGTAGTANGAFATEEEGTYIATASDGHVLVGDEGRIQKFEADGSFEENITLSGSLAGHAVTSLAIAPDGSLWVTSAEEGEAFVHKLSPLGADLITPPLRSEPTASSSLIVPIFAATDEAGNVYTASFNINSRLIGGEEFQARFFKEVLEYAPNGSPIISAPNGLSVLTGFGSFFKGIALNTVSASAGVDLITAVEQPGETFLRAYGAVPTKFGPPPKVAPSILSQSQAAIAATSAQVSAQINPHFWADTTYYVEYGTGKCSEGGCTTQTPSPPGASLSSNDAGLAIQAQPVTLTGLTPSTTYHFRIVTQSSGSEGLPIRGVGGTVGSNGTEGTFTTAKEAVLPPEADCPNRSFRAGPGQRLANCRAYEMVSPVEKNQIDILPLPNINSDRDILDQSSPDGSALTYTTSQGFGDAEGVPYVSQYLASRGTGGWTSQDLTPPQGISGAEPGNRAELEFRAFTENLCTGYLLHTTDPPLAPGAPPGLFNIYRRQICGGKALEATTRAPLPIGEDSLGFVPKLQAISADGRCAAFFRDKSVRLFESCEGVEREVGILPSGRISESASAGTRGVDRIGLRSGTTKSSVSSDGRRVYWTDGPSPNTRAPFSSVLLLRQNADQPPSARANGGAWGAGNLTAASALVEEVLPSGGEFRVGQEIVGEGIPDATSIIAMGPNTLTLSQPAESSLEDAAFEASSPCTEPSKACTVRLPMPAGAKHIKGDSERFWAATPDGGSVLYSFSDGQDTQLLKYTLQSGQLTTIATEMVGGLLGASTDLSHFSFASEKVLTTQANPAGAKATAGRPNLYLFDGNRSGAKRYIFVGTLDAGDAAMFTTSTYSALGEEPARHVSRITPSGTAVAFMSTARLTGYDNTDAVSGEKDLEIFLYDEEGGGGTGTLTCVSCNPNGARPTGRRLILAGFPSKSWGAALLPPFYTELTGPHALSDDGRHLFFNSYEPLIGSDINGKADVYEWEAPGTDGTQGNCTTSSPVYSPANGGCVTLISSGTSKSDSELIEASPSGQDVFFSTAESLVTEDPGLLDIYDARVGGGFPTKAAAIPCEGEACQPSSSAPANPTPQTGQVRPGNKCPKGLQAKKRKKGAPIRCVPKNAEKKHHKKKGKHHERGKGHAKKGKHGHQSGKKNQHGRRNG